MIGSSDHGWRAFGVHVVTITGLPAFITRTAVAHRDAETGHQDSGDEGNDHHRQVGRAISTVNRVVHGTPSCPGKTHNAARQILLAGRRCHTQVLKYTLVLKQRLST
jgi:hypothetical protein